MGKNGIEHVDNKFFKAPKHISTIYFIITLITMQPFLFFFFLSLFFPSCEMQCPHECWKTFNREGQSSNKIHAIIYSNI